ncbi:MAG TPA: (2Fe-2S)-binding protein [Mycobacterium sp.]|nr:(2Fe-2S)-binding protein [Mycobacterium sp.]
MYVCLCLGITTETVREAIDCGASTSRQVAAACGAGSQCGRCRRTVRAIIASESDARSKHHFWHRVKHLSA